MFENGFTVPQTVDKDCTVLSTRWFRASEHKALTYNEDNMTADSRRRWSYFLVEIVAVFSLILPGFAVNLGTF